MHLRFGALVIILMLASCGGGEPGTGATPSPEAEPVSAPSAPPETLAAPDLTAYAGIPAPAGEHLQRLADIRRDLDAIARGEPDASGELADDLASLSSRDAPPPARALGAFVRQIDMALARTTPDEAETTRVAQLLWVVAHARRLDDAGIARLQKDVEAALMAAGADEASARSAAREVRTLVGEMTQ